MFCFCLWLEGIHVNKCNREKYESEKMNNRKTAEGLLKNLSKFEVTFVTIIQIAVLERFNKASTVNLCKQY